MQPKNRKRAPEDNIGVHCHMIRQRARRHDPKDRKGRAADRRAAISRSKNGE